MRSHRAKTARSWWAGDRLISPRKRWASTGLPRASRMLSMVHGCSLIVASYWKWHLHFETSVKAVPLLGALRFHLVRSLASFLAAEPAPVVGFRFGDGGPGVVGGLFRAPRAAVDGRVPVFASVDGLAACARGEPVGLFAIGRPVVGAERAPCRSPGTAFLPAPPVQVD